MYHSRGKEKERRKERPEKEVDGTTNIKTKPSREDPRGKRTDLTGSKTEESPSKKKNHADEEHARGKERRISPRRATRGKANLKQRRIGRSHEKPDRKRSDWTVPALFQTSFS